MRGASAEEVPARAERRFGGTVMPHKNTWKSSTCLAIGAAAMAVVVSGTASLGAGAGAGHGGFGHAMGRSGGSEMQAQSVGFGAATQLRVVNMPASASLIGARSFGAAPHADLPSASTGREISARAHQFYTPDARDAPHADLPAATNREVSARAQHQLYTPDAPDAPHADLPAATGREISARAQHQLYTPETLASPGSSLLFTPVASPSGR